MIHGEGTKKYGPSHLTPRTNSQNLHLIFRSLDPLSRSFKFLITVIIMNELIIVITKSSQKGKTGKCFSSSSISY